MTRVRGLVLLALAAIAVAEAREPPAQPSPDAGLALHCLYPLGGGMAQRETLVLPQPERESCAATLAQYVRGGQYEKDLNIALNAAEMYIGNATRFPQVNSSMVVIFDIDETSLSNLGILASDDLDLESGDVGVLVAQKTLELIMTASAPAIPQTLRVYKMLREMGFGVTFITGRSEALRGPTTANLMLQGYGSLCSKGMNVVKAGELCYLELAMRNSTDVGKPATIYKSERREAFLKRQDGSRFVAALGDQWSDLLGAFGAEAVFKVPNPVYYLV